MAMKKLFLLWVPGRVLFRITAADGMAWHGMACAWQGVGWAKVGCGHVPGRLLAVQAGSERDAQANAMQVQTRPPTWAGRLRPARVKRHNDPGSGTHHSTGCTPRLHGVHAGAVGREPQEGSNIG